MAVSDVSWVVQSGAVELALGAVSGWLVALSVDRPAVLRRLGVRAAPRLRQAHLDWIVMGVLCIAVGLAAPDLPVVAAVCLVVGAWVNATLFVPLAFVPEATGWLPYKALSVLSFATMSFGTVAAAVHIVG